MSLKNITLNQKLKNYELSEIGSVNLDSPNKSQKAKVRKYQNEQSKIKRSAKDNLSIEKLQNSLSSNRINDDIKNLISDIDIKER